MQHARNDRIGANIIIIFICIALKTYFEFVSHMQSRGDSVDVSLTFGPDSYIFRRVIGLTVKHNKCNNAWNIHIYSKLSRTGAVQGMLPKIAENKSVPSGIALCL